MIHEYLFDVKLFAAIRVRADDEKKARRLLAETVECSTANLGAWPDGEPVVCEVSLDDEEEANAVLIEVDGEDPDAEEN